MNTPTHKANHMNNMHMCWIDAYGNVCEGQYKMITVFDMCMPFLNGKGTMTVGKGLKYEGYFIEGIKHGPFIVTDLSKGESVHVHYENGTIKN